VLLAREQSLPYFLKVLGRTQPRAGLELTSPWMLSKNNNTRLRQAVLITVHCSFDFSGLNQISWDFLKVAYVSFTYCYRISAEQLNKTLVNVFLTRQEKAIIYR
jgi:hypothetical protein